MRCRHYFLLLSMGLFFFWSPTVLYSQQYKTDTIFLERQKAARERLRQKQEADRRRQRYNPQKSDQFLEGQQVNNARVQLNGTQEFLFKRKSVTKRQQGWNNFVQQKSNQKLKQNRDGSITIPVPQSIQDVRRNFLAKKQSEQTFLKSKTIGSQENVSRKLLFKKNQYAKFLGQQLNFQGKLKELSPKEVQKVLYSKKAREFQAFAQRQKMLNVKRQLNDVATSQKSIYSNRAGEFQAFADKRARLRQQKVQFSPQNLQKQLLSNKAAEFQAFAQKQKKLKEAAPALSKEQKYVEKISAKAGDFQKFIGDQTIREGKVEGLRTAAGIQRQLYNARGAQFTKFLGDRKTLQDKAKMVVLSPKEALQKKYSAKALEFQGYIAVQAKNQTALEEQVKEQNALFIKKQPVFNQYLTKGKTDAAKLNQALPPITVSGRRQIYNDFADRNQKKLAALPVDVNKIPEKTLSKYQSFVANRKERSDLISQLGADDARAAVYRGRAQEFQNFVANRKERAGLVVQEDPKDVQNRIYSEKAVDFQNFVKNRQEKAKVVGQILAQDATAIKLQANAPKFQLFLENQKKKDANLVRVNPQEALQVQFAGKQSEFQAFVDNRQQKAAVASVSFKNSAELQRIEFEKRTPEFDQFVAKRREKDQLLGVGQSPQAVQQRVFQGKQGEYNDFVSKGKQLRDTQLKFNTSADEVQQRINQSKAPEYRAFVDRSRAKNQGLGVGVSGQEARQIQYRQSASQYDLYLENQKKRVANATNFAARPENAEQQRKRKSRYTEFTDRRAEVRQQVRPTSQTTAPTTPTQAQRRTTPLRSLILPSNGGAFDTQAPRMRRP